MTLDRPAITRQHRLPDGTIAWQTLAPIGDGAPQIIDYGTLPPEFSLNQVAEAATQRILAAGITALHETTQPKLDTMAALFTGLTVLAGHTTEGT